MIDFSDDVEVVWVRHVLSEIRRICPELEISETARWELARAIAGFCVEQGHVSVIPQDFFTLVLVRALRGIGENDAASRVGRRAIHDRECADIYLQNLWAGPMSADMWDVFAARLLRPSRWLAANGEVVWILDLARLSNHSSAGLELALLPAVRVLMERMRPVWAPHGEGTLGLVGKAALAHHIPGLMAYLTGFCQCLLRRICHQAGWPHCPHVIELDCFTLSHDQATQLQNSIDSSSEKT